MFSTKDIKEVYRAEIRHPAYVLKDEGKQKLPLQPNSKPTLGNGEPLKTIRAYPYNSGDFPLPKFSRTVHA